MSVLLIFGPVFKELLVRKRKSKVHNTKVKSFNKISYVKSEHGLTQLTNRKVNNRNTRKIGKICSKFTINTPER